MARGLDTGQGEAAVVEAVAGSGNGSRALHMAASGGSMDVLRYLVEDLRLGVIQFNDIGHCEIVELLLSRGVHVNLDSIAGTPLHAAAINSQHSTMKILLEHHTGVGADVNFRDSNGVTCVMMAADHASSDIMKCLLYARANPNIPDGFNTTPIEVAAH
ncbi:hypothetical protein E2562_030656 [Oryza meyeriana var. granulata]|uniref:PGG domain-containing protein n=1 Tax=Oryza meyeriana var. granulata TaxID=110450 RepID=A0A6G1DBC8_9ORYZ|nr:hypothetical protein E2562_030656 [Oryza meyeriana var. granulata]